MASAFGHVFAAVTTIGPANSSANGVLMLRSEACWIGLLSAILLFSKYVGQRLAKR